MTKRRWLFVFVAVLALGSLPTSASARDQSAGSTLVPLVLSLDRIICLSEQLWCPAATGQAGAAPSAAARVPLTPQEQAHAALPPDWLPSVPVMPKLTPPEQPSAVCSADDAVCDAVRGDDEWL